MVCQTCGTVHHRACWRKHERCGAYSCIPGRRTLDLVAEEPVLRISSEELAQAVPAPAVRPAPAVAPVRPARTERDTRMNRMAIVSLALGVAGIPFCITGLLAVLFGGISLAGIRGTAQRGAGLAITGILLGLVGSVGWLIVLVWAASTFTVLEPIEYQEFQPDIESVKDLDPQIRRAMLANVLIEHRAGFAKLALSVGSGVILGIDNGEAVIVTNRHVIDSNYSPSTVTEADLKSIGKLDVRMFGATKITGRVVWTAPGGVDLALVRVPWSGAGQAQAAKWRKGRPMAVGEPVFAIGNPHRLGWTHTQGVISQFRKQQMGARVVRLIQTQTALNPGNSGGGLFDRDGYLIGINTLAHDKRVAEGIGFAISFDTLLEFAPADLAKLAHDEPGRPEPSEPKSPANPKGAPGRRSTPARGRPAELPSAVDDHSAAAVVPTRLTISRRYELS